MDGNDMSETAIDLLADWLHRRLSPADSAWLTSRIIACASDPGDTSLHIAFGMMPRRLGKSALALSPEDVAAADQRLAGWSPRYWSMADAGRVLLLSSLPERQPDFAPRFRALCQTAEVSESISLYRGLSLYPGPAALEPQVGEGLRTNIRSVFEAIAHHNPYPRTYFDTHRWNHMILKALFVDSRLAPIQGLDERANAELARIMLDFAHERWAAGRAVPYEIWRCVGPFAAGTSLDDLARVLASGTPVEQKAAALALTASPDPAAMEIVEQRPDLARDIAAGRLNWATLQ
jgi:hypothetical protein